MRFPRRRRRVETPRVETPPENVRLTIGRAEYPCGVIRDPDQDKDGCAAWVAVPREPIPPDVAHAILAGTPVGVRADMLPAKSLLLADLDLGPVEPDRKEGPTP